MSLNKISLIKIKSVPKKFKNTQEILDFLNKDILDTVDEVEYFISGGCLVDIDRNKAPKDIDVYFEKESEFIKFNNLLSRITLQTEKHYLGEEYEDIKPLSTEVRFLANTHNASTYEITKNGKTADVQLINRKFDNIDTMLEDFDLSVVRRYLTKDNVIHEHKTYSKDLRVLGNYSAHTLQRLFKYKDKGFNLESTEIYDVIKGILNSDKLPNYYSVNTSLTPLELLTEFFCRLSLKNKLLKLNNETLFEFLFKLLLKEYKEIYKFSKESRQGLRSFFYDSMYSKKVEEQKHFQELSKNKEFMICTYLSIKEDFNEDDHLIKQFMPLKEDYPEFFL